MTEITKHSPGPWRAEPSAYGFANGRPYVAVYDAADNSIAQVLVNKLHWESGENMHPYEANARLIALAPEMAEFIMNCGCAGSRELVEKIGAISKAAPLVETGGHSQ